MAFKKTGETTHIAVVDPKPAPAKTAAVNAEESSAEERLRLLKAKALGK
jgi:hypothetical protein